MTPKNVTTLYSPPVLSRFISARQFAALPKLEMKLKGLHFVDVADIQVVITDELKKVQNDEFLAAFQKLYDGTKTCIYDNGAYFELKKRHASSILENQS